MLALRVDPQPQDHSTDMKPSTLPYSVGSTLTYALPEVSPLSGLAVDNGMLPNNDESKLPLKTKTHDYFSS